MIVEFVGQTRADADNATAAPAKLVNLYRERLGERTVLKSVPGMVSFSSLATVLGRQMIEVNDTLYAVAGGFLYSVDSAGNDTSLGSVTDDIDTTMAGYSTNVMVTAGGNYYVWDGSTFGAVTGGAFSNVGSVTFLSGWTILTEKNGSRFEWTELQDPSTRNALYVATAEANDDPLRRGLVSGGNLYLFGHHSTEIWGLTGQAGASAFARLAGGVIDTGLKSSALAVDTGGSVFFVGDDDLVYLMAGAGLRNVASPAVSTAIAQGSPTNVFYYEEDGHKFCVVRFSDRPAWVYDMAMDEWHERATGNELEEWSAVASARVYGRWMVVDNTGTVSSLQRVNTDLGATMLRKAVSNTLEVNGDRFRVSMMEVRARTGFSDLGRDAQIILRLSGDRGATWGPPKPRDIGGLGNYSDRAVWRSLGQFRTLTAEISMGDATDAPIFADMRLEIA